MFAERLKYKSLCSIMKLCDYLLANAPEHVDINDVTSRRNRCIRELRRKEFKNFLPKT